VAADLALSAAMPVARWVEFQTGVPYIEEIITTPFKIDGDGLLAIPNKPGLGIEINWEAVEKYTPRQ
jgi:L-alanine-DL-glutamate epimerase-like enolase superfamily enzyme